MKIYTVGYEGSSIEEFTANLKKQGIGRIADVRKNPVSRKKGFSKRLLAEALGKRGIEYIHLPNLGMPKEWRDLAKQEVITRAKMFKDYEKKILPKQHENLSLLRTLMKEKNTALLCYEADPSDCHRSSIAQELAKREKRGAKIMDLEIHPVAKGLQLFK